jgi:transcriptional regulator with XRE-family HTH domain
VEPSNATYQTLLQRERCTRGWPLTRVVAELNKLAGKELGLDPNTVSRYELGKIKRPRPPIPELFSRLYGKPVTRLFPAFDKPIGRESRQPDDTAAIADAELAPSEPEATLEALAPVGTLDLEMLRRHFLRVLAAAGGQAGAALLPLDHSGSSPQASAHPVATDITVEAVTAVTGQYRRLEATTPAGELLDPVLAHLRFVSQLLEPEATMASPQLAAAASEAAGFAGWLAVDRNNHAAARRHYQSAIDLAERSGNDLLRAYMLGSKSQWAAALDSGSEAVQLITHARSLLPRQAPPATRAWVGALEATAYASRRDKPACLAAIRRANAAVGRYQAGSVALWPWVYPFDHAKIAGYLGACAVKLKLPAEAFPALHDGLDALEPVATKQRAMLLLDLAAAHVLVHDVEAACQVAGEAFVIGVQRRSEKVIRQVCDVRARLTPWSMAAAVQDLDQRLLATLLPSPPAP